MKLLYNCVETILFSGLFSVHLWNLILHLWGKKWEKFENNLIYKRHSTVSGQLYLQNGNIFQELRLRVRGLLIFFFLQYKESELYKWQMLLKTVILQWIYVLLIFNIFDWDSDLISQRRYFSASGYDAMLIRKRIFSVCYVLQRFCLISVIYNGISFFLYEIRAKRLLYLIHFIHYSTKDSNCIKEKLCYQWKRRHAQSFYNNMSHHL